MNTSLDSLDPVFKPLAFALLARLVEARIPVVIVNTRRTAAEQAVNIANGTSKVQHSKHEDGLAIDIAPYETYVIHGSNKLDWDTHDPVWLRIGQIGESLNMRWGGRFKPLNGAGIGWDPGHMEYAGAVTPVIGVPV